MQIDVSKIEFLATKRTWLITGVAGFIGSHLLESLLKLNQDVIGIDNFSIGKQQNLDEVKACVTPIQWSQFKLIKGDIRNLGDCFAACESAEIVLHQAAHGSVPKSIENPISFNENNVDGFINMLIAARDSGALKFVYASTSAIYGDSPKLPKSEIQSYNPLSPYALTKMINENYAELFSRCYNFPSIGLRYFNVYGERQDSNGSYAAVIPKWITGLISGDNIFINGDGSTTRDFCYVGDVVRANILAATTENNAALNQVFNVSSGDETTLNELFWLINSGLLKKIKIPKFNLIYRSFQTGDIKHSLADISKARKILNFLPEHKLSATLPKILDWYISKLTP